MIPRNSRFFISPDLLEPEEDEEKEKSFRSILLKNIKFAYKNNEFTDCECGACYTSNPFGHYKWCPRYKLD